MIALENGRVALLADGPEPQLPVMPGAGEHAVRHGLAVYPRDGRDADALIAAAGAARGAEPAPAKSRDDPSLVVADPHMDRIVRLIRRIACA